METEKKYEELAKKYKYEIHKSLKGWGIISYFIVSIILIVVSGFVLEVWGAGRRRRYAIFRI